MNRKRVLISILVIVVLIGVALGLYFIFRPQPAQADPDRSAEALAAKALEDYLLYLSEGDYQQAAELYGGSYDMLEGYNPDVDPDDHPLLLERACKVNGLNCLQLRSAVLNQINFDNEFVFLVELQTNDGDLFEIGPCCGEDEEGFTPIAVFTFTVVQVGPDQYQVMDLPPYTP